MLEETGSGATGKDMKPIDHAMLAEGAVPLNAPLIVHVVRQFLPNRGGLEDVVYNLARHSLQAGYRVRVVTLNSLTVMPAQLTTGALTASKGLLLLAVTATAMRSRMDLLMQMGWRSTVPVIAATLASFAAALAFVLVLL